MSKFYQGTGPFLPGTRQPSYKGTLMADRNRAYTIEEKFTKPAQALPFHENSIGFVCFSCHHSELWQNVDPRRTAAEYNTSNRLPDRELVKRIAQIEHHEEVCPMGRKKINTWGFVVIYKAGGVRSIEAHATKYADGTFREEYEKMLGMWTA